MCSACFVMASFCNKLHLLHLLCCVSLTVKTLCDLNGVESTITTNQPTWYVVFHHCVSLAFKARQVQFIMYVQTEMQVRNDKDDVQTIDAVLNGIQTLNSWTLNMTLHRYSSVPGKNLAVKNVSKMSSGTLKLKLKYHSVSVDTCKYTDTIFNFTLQVLYLRGGALVTGQYKIADGYHLRHPVACIKSRSESWTRKESYHGIMSHLSKQQYQINVLSDVA